MTTKQPPEIVRNFKPHTEGNKYGQIFQSVSVEFAFINKEGEEVFSPVQCRDFLCDAILSKYSGKNIHKWGFKYNYADTPFEDGWISVHFPDHESMENFMNYDSVFIKEVYVVNPNTILCKVSKHYFNDTWKISFLTMWMRFWCYRDFSKLKSPDSNYYAKVSPYFDMLCFLINKPTKIWDDYKELPVEYHDQIGVIYSLPKLKAYAEKKKCAPMPQV